MTSSGVATSGGDATASRPNGASSRPAYPPPAAQPTQSGPDGLRFDFNMGARVLVPEGDWRVELRDLDTGNILFQSSKGGVFVNSAKRYYVRFRIEAWKDGASVFVHDYDSADRDVLIQFPVGTLGDMIAWFPYAARFQEERGCRLTCAMSELLIPLFRNAYPNIAFVTHGGVDPARFYATYSIGLFFDDADGVWQPCDFRLVGLHKTAGYILGVDPDEVRPRIVLPDDTRPAAEPYVCIAAQSSSQAKYWNNPAGWREVVKFLKESGYRVVCIDKQPFHGTGIVWNHIPHGAEDMTGLSLQESARWLRHADFFVGLSSGLSWLAWAAETPVVLISGFSHPTTEFATPYRIINYHACNSCWSDPRHRFDHHDFLWCPRQAGTPRQFECTRLITPDHVKAVIRRIPAFQAHSAGEKSADRVAPFRRAAE